MDKNLLSFFILKNKKLKVFVKYYNKRHFMKKIIRINKIKKSIIHIYKYVIHHKKVFIIPIIVIVLVALFINNKIKQNRKIENVQNIENVEKQKNDVIIKIHGGVINDYYGSIEKGSYLCDIILNYCNGLSDYADIENINLLFQINNDYSIYINEDEIKKNNIINIIDYSNQKEWNYRILKRNSFNDPIMIYKVDKKIDDEDFLLLINKKDEDYSNDKGDKEIIKININIASINELMAINGISEKRAQSIIEYRENVALFKSIEDVKKVSGIGEATFEKIKDYICVE